MKYTVFYVFYFRHAGLVIQKNKYKHFFSKLVNMFSDCMLSLINSCCEHAKAYIYISSKWRKSKVD